MEIYMDTMYLRGDISEAHLEGEINFTEKEEEDFKTLLKKEINEEELTEEEFERLEIYKEDIGKECHIVIDDFYITDYGDFVWEDLLER